MLDLVAVMIMQCVMVAAKALGWLPLPWGAVLGGIALWSVALVALWAVKLVKLIKNKESPRRKPRA